MNTTQNNLDKRTGRTEQRSKAAGRILKASGDAFTLIELLVVIGIIALLAGLIVGLSAYTGRKLRESRIRAELDQLVTAIEAYHARFNQYPPDNVVSRNPLVVNPVTNSLFYELSGVIVEPNNKFHLPNRTQQFSASTVQTFFNTDGFVNAGANAREIKPCASFKSSQHKAIAALPADIELLAVPVDWPSNDPRFPPPFNSPDPNVKRINPWRYVSTQPTNNPASFDLWAEYVEGAKVRVICNWSRNILERGQ
ncbi:MAG: hypothetical protein DME19_21040 [Verrucomicrobia bacterium]|nr:MAG: hypothetical protein DME19_21040 [Verrucomicrobiota bacterium]